jgi:molybdopterin/thiamine biosynthesis adenylyltransferase/ubiquitin-protein ligase
LIEINLKHSVDLKLIDDSKTSTPTSTEVSTSDKDKTGISGADLKKKISEIMATKTPRTNKSAFTEEFANSLTMYPKDGQVAPATKTWSQHKAGSGTEFWSYKALGRKYNEQVELELEADFEFDISLLKIGFHT